MDERKDDLVVVVFEKLFGSSSTATAAQKSLSAGF